MIAEWAELGHLWVNQSRKVVDGGKATDLVNSMPDQEGCAADFAAMS